MQLLQHGLWCCEIWVSYDEVGVIHLYLSMEVNDSAADW